MKTHSRHHVSVRQQASKHAVVSHDEHTLIKKNTRPILFFTLISLVVIVALVFGFKQWIPEYNKGANVGGGSQLERIPRLLKKPTQCSEDRECPDESRCTPEGLCAPILVRLPVTVAQPGSGREGEKNTK